MKNLEVASGLVFTLGGDKVNYEKANFATAVDWAKTKDEGSYSYAKAETELKTLYFGGRYMESNQDEQVFLDNDFMADLTVINPGKVGDEFVKTVGHYHQNLPGLTIAYPEAYEAISGKLEYLLQSEPDVEGKVAVIWVVAEPGEKVVMPPNFGHVSMNVGSEPAVEVDLQKRDNPNGSDYSMFRERVGGALYRTVAGLTKNPNYEISSLRIVKPREKAEWGLTKDKPLYTSFVENPEKFQWLLKPQDFVFDIDELFEDVEL